MTRYSADTNNRVAFWGVFVAMCLMMMLFAVDRYETEQVEKLAEQAKAGTADRFTGSDATAIVALKDQQAELRDEQLRLLRAVVCADPAVQSDLCSRNWELEIDRLKIDFCRLHRSQSVCAQFGELDDGALSN